MSEDEKVVPAVSRRVVLKTLPVLAMGAGIGVTTTGCGGASIPSTTVIFGPPESLDAGAPRRLASYDVYLVRNAQGVAAISGRCTHRGCGVTPVEGGFHCGCHGSEFSTDGTVTHGPARTDLPWFAVQIENDQIVVDPNREVPKGTYTSLDDATPLTS